jgi:peptidoglycan/LPS O-acetylase OafA/YrhL
MLVWRIVNVLDGSIAAESLMQVAEPVALELPSRPVPSYASYLSCKYFSSLDVFRFLAIMAVLWHHTSEGFAWFPASRLGFLGVDLFFVISGFLIVTLLLRERDRTGGISLRQFYLRRSLRIFPIYYGMLGAVTAFFLFVKPHSAMAGPFFAELPYQAFYLSNFWGGHTILFFTWSLAAEEQFYLAWPPVEKWLRGYVVPLLLAVIVINQLINFGLLGATLAEFANRLAILQITFTPICLGVLLAHALHDGRWFDRIASFLGRPWTSLVLTASLFVVCNILPGDLAGWPRLLIQTLMALLLASCVIQEDNWLNQMLGFRLVRRIGVISYGMYLYHEFAAHAVKFFLGSEKTASPFSFFLVASALTILAAELSFRFYETPFLKLKDRLHTSARKKARAFE